eukprot:Selendium_serpulae@DN3618_c0_g1_i4.p1
MLMDIVKADADFFRNHEILDYSLLVGVHHRSHFLSAGSSMNISGADLDNQPSGVAHPPRHLSIMPQRTNIMGTTVGDLRSPAMGRTRGGSIAASHFGQPYGDGLNESDSMWTSPKPFHQRDFGGMVSTDGKLIIYIGIIDILTEWTARKQAEYLARTVQTQSRSGISCVPPKSYSERFVKAMEGHFI